MYIDIHRHGAIVEENLVVLRNLFPEQAGEAHEGSFFSAGLHPWHVTMQDINQGIPVIEELARLKQVIAIGETGLDAKVNVSYPEQLLAFEKQIEIAEKHRKPVIIHCVKAYNDLVVIRKKSDLKIPWIVHWFNASQQIATQLMENNCYLSFGYSLFNENSKAYKLFATIPPDRFFLETDDTGYTISEVYSRAANLRQAGEPDIKKTLIANFEKCFNLTI